jgi:hypothetical protein
MSGYVVTRLMQNPLGQEAPTGQRGDIVRVSNGWATIHLDPGDFDRITEGRMERMLDEADKRPNSARGVHTPAGGRGLPMQQTNAVAPDQP